MKRCIQEATRRRRFAQGRCTSSSLFQCHANAAAAVQVPHYYFASATFSTSQDSRNSLQVYEDIIGSEIGSIDSSGWEKARGFLEDPSSGVAHSFHLLDRLAEERDNHHLLLGKSPLNSVIANWKHGLHENHQDETAALSPDQVFEQVKAWKSNPVLRPDTVTFAMILDAAIHYNPKLNPEECAVLANSILEYMLEEAPNSTTIIPNARCFGAVMNAWAQSDSHKAPQMVETWIQRMTEFHEDGWPDVQPAVVVYNILLKALARANDMERAENLLNDMLESKILVTPDSTSFTTLLLAYSNRGSPDAALKAEQLLTQMHQLYDAGLELAKPNVVSYTTVIQVYAKSGQPDKAEALLWHLQELYQTTEDPDWMPDEAVYNTALLAWANNRQPDRVDKLLHSMYEIGFVKPNERSFNIAISSWAKVGAAERAELLLSRMHELFEAGEIDARPTVVTYNVVLDSWAKSNTKHALQRAEKIVEYMKELSARGDRDVTPNVRTWNTLINCFAKAGRAYDTLRMVKKFWIATKDRKVEAKPNIRTWNTILAACLHSQDIKTARQTWNFMQTNGIRPNVVSYNTLLTLFARCRVGSNRQRRQQVAKSVDSILNELESDSDVVPNRITYLAFVDAWLNADKTRRAESFLDDLYTKFVAGEGTILPDREMYDKVLDGWARRKLPKAAEMVLLKMAEYQSQGHDVLKPTVDTYNRVLNAWAETGATDCGERADRILRQMQQLVIYGEDDLAPDTVSYNTVLKAWKNSGSPIAIAQVEHLVLEMILKGDPKTAPDTVSYTTWIQTIEASDEDDKGRFAREVIKTMKIQNIEDPPKYILEKIQSWEVSDPNLSGA